MKNNFKEIENPSFEKDQIPTGLLLIEDIEKIIKLNDLVIKVIEGAIVNDIGFGHLKQKYFKTLNDAEENYSDSVLSNKKTIISGGTYGGNHLN